MNHKYAKYGSKVCINKNGKEITCMTQQLSQPIAKGSKQDFNFSISEEVSKDNKLIWWTWDLGSPELVNVTVDVHEIENRKVIDERRVRTGFRTVKVIQTKDAKGTSFVVNLNGYDVFMRGGNYIPPEMSMAKVKKEQYDKIKEYAIFGKFNMIRVWGGGQFEHDSFYEAMDEAGILIWHDLMFACAMYPVYDIDGESML